MRTRRLVPLLAVLGTLMAITLPAAAAPPTRTPGRAIEAFARYQGQSTCSPTAKKGTIALRNLVLHTYGGTGDFGIIRNCKIGGRSEHKEGRAWDWKVSAKNPKQVRAVNDFMRWALRTDKYGNKAAMARRLGIMYMIWNHRIWSASSNSWRRYNGSNPHTNHVHISLSWAGALKKTSYWTGHVAPGAAAPLPAPPRPVVPPAPRPSPVPTPPTTTPPTTTPPTTPPAPVLTSPVTLTVPAASAKGVTTGFRLAEGQRYRIDAVGTYQYSPDAIADPECSRYPDGSWQRRSAWEQDGTWQGSSGDLDLSANGHTRWNTLTGASCEPVTHHYWMEIDPRTTGPLTLKVTDDVYDDNVGTLAVTITPLGSAWS